MADWDADSRQLRENLKETLRGIREDARQRQRPTVEAARRWHVTMLRALSLPDPQFAGRFRGEAGLEDLQVVIGRHQGIGADEIAGQLARFEQTLQQAVSRLDELLPPGVEVNADSLEAVLNLCAWVHAEWVRIHPFANGNGRTARLWANSLAMRYGLPPFVRLRPRPDDGYASAGEKAMTGDWKPTAALFRRMFSRFLSGAAR